MNQQNFIPFGAQYYRYPTPGPECWADDIVNIKRHGFNTIKIWAQWRSNNPRPGVFDFRDIVTLLDLAGEQGIKVIINVILDVAPAWFYKQHPESVMMTADGRLLTARSTAYRQAGGAPGPCYHHGPGADIKRKFIECLSKEIHDHPALLMWDLWNEPELTCGIAREPSTAEMVCYCDSSRLRFLEWLKAKYCNIKNLNLAWQRNYNDFDEIELPYSAHVFNDMIDWRTFFADTLVEDLKLRIDSVKKYDHEHQIMVHTVPPPYFNMINACCDDYKMAKMCDLFGNSISSDPFPAALSVSAANGKPVINAEIHAVSGETFNRPSPLTFENFKHHILIPFSQGIKGFLFWQYRPEILGRESPAWGLTDLCGNDTKYIAHAKQINDMLVQNIEITAVCKPPKSTIAIIKDNSGEIFSWCADSSTEKHMTSVTGSFRAFYDLGYNVDIITLDQMMDNDLSNYKLIYFPLPYYQNQAACEKLALWIEQGGVFFSEAFFGAYRAECGLHSLIVPGYGFDEIFGARETAATTATKFIAAYGEKQVAYNDCNVLTINYKTADENINIQGYHFCEELSPTTGKITGRFSDGAPAIVENNYGKGRAVIAGSLIGYGYEQNKNKDTLKFFNILAQMADIKRSVRVSSAEVHADILYAPAGLALVFKNTSEDAGQVCVSFDTEKYPYKCFDAQTREQIPLQWSDGTAEITIDLPEGSIRLYIVNFADCEFQSVKS